MFIEIFKDKFDVWLDFFRPSGFALVQIFVSEGRKNGEVEGTLWYPHRPKKAEIKAKYHCRESQMTGVGRSLGPSLV